MPSNVRFAIVRAAAGNDPKVAAFLRDTTDPEDLPAPADLTPSEFLRRLNRGDFDFEDDHA